MKLKAWDNIQDFQLIAHCFSVEPMHFLHDAKGD